MDPIERHLPFSWLQQRYAHTGKWGLVYTAHNLTSDSAWTSPCGERWRDCPGCRCGLTDGCNLWICPGELLVSLPANWSLRAGQN